MGEMRGRWEQGTVWVREGSWFGCSVPVLVMDVGVGWTTKKEEIRGISGIFVVVVRRHSEYREGLFFDGFSANTWCQLARHISYLLWPHVLTLISMCAACRLCIHRWQGQQ